MKLATIKDIAKKLGISHSTVSRVMNNDPRISAATKELVIKAAREMNYSPNTSARSLAGGKSNTIAVVTPAYFSIYSAEVMRGIETEVIKTGYEMDYYTTRRFTVAGVMGREVSIFEKILDERKADALISISGNVYGRGDILGRYKKAGIHVIFIEGKGGWGHRVHYDNERAAATAVNHLAERKRKRIGMLIGNTRDVESYKERLAGFKKAMKELDLSADDGNIISFDTDHPGIQKTAMDFFMEKKIDGIYVGTGDYTAFRLFDEIQKRGLKMPDDIALVGQDNAAVSMAAEITTISQPMMEMGKKAIEIAARAIEEKDMNMRDEIFYPELIKRKTT
jgi:DNA-binding LacI/PurR family transcriptional regulator